ncbi:hypothetical protein [Paenarthrobacter sp. PH39-S1]|uniref:hypothetical protein n=1 Tax=Paenarthrobacter sp. PH39-S1 TaxID=3046204 RepID=UPI0024B94879|nr:hypothetical protein [Paenarthrobacter sp. PH39-S1]MDJ0357545.1 hypothetical protein [Paenarthrobacter sp. PH39-S1]
MAPRWAASELVATDDHHERDFLRPNRLGQLKVNYHLKALERHGLVELIQERRKGNVSECIVPVMASSFVISPAALAAVQPDPGLSPDRLSARWVLAVEARPVVDVGTPMTGAAAAQSRLPPCHGRRGPVRQRALHPSVTAARYPASSPQAAGRSAGLIEKQNRG